MRLLKKKKKSYFDYSIQPNTAAETHPNTAEKSTGQNSMVFSGLVKKCTTEHQAKPSAFESWSLTFPTGPTSSKEREKVYVVFQQGRKS